MSENREKIPILSQRAKGPPAMPLKDPMEFLLAYYVIKRLVGVVMTFLCKVYGQKLMAFTNGSLSHTT